MPSRSASSISSGSAGISSGDSSAMTVTSSTPARARGARDVEGRGHRRGGRRRRMPATERRPVPAARRPPSGARARCGRRRTRRCRRRRRRPARPRSTRKPWFTLSRNSTARSTPSSSWPGRSRSRPRPVPTARNSAAWRSRSSSIECVSPTRSVRLDVDAELDDRLDLAGDERAGQPVLGDAEHHHPAEPIVRLVDRDRMTGEAKVVRGREPGGSAADHADRGQRRGRHLAVRLVPDRVRGEALDAEALGDEALERADRHGRVDRAPPARALARRGAHAPADRRERVRGPGDEVRVLEAALGDRRDVRAGVGVDRARGAAGLVRPQPIGVGRGGIGHQISFRRWSWRSAHANASRTTKNIVRREPRRGCCVSRRAPSSGSRWSRTTSDRDADDDDDRRRSAIARNQPIVGVGMRCRQSSSQLDREGGAHADAVVLGEVADDARSCRRSCS